MNAKDVIALYSEIQRRGIEIWIDGGWGVDVLLREQTRAHSDLDIVIQQQDVAALRTLLEGKGYRDVPRDDTRAWVFVLGDEAGRQVDVHVIVFDGSGNGIYGPKENGEMYPAASLTGSGVIDGCPVRCISPEYLVKFHTGYKLDANDYADVAALCERFGIELPEECARVKKSN